MHEPTTSDLRYLRVRLADMANTNDNGVFCDSPLPGDLWESFRAYGYFEEDVAVRKPDDQAHWRRHIQQLVAEAREMLTTPDGDWHAALATLNRAKGYEEHMLKRYHWVTDKGLAAFAEAGLEINPVHMCTYFR